MDRAAFAQLTGRGGNLKLPRAAGCEASAFSSCISKETSNISGGCGMRPQFKKKFLPTRLLAFSASLKQPSFPAPLNFKKKEKIIKKKSPLSLNFDKTAKQTATETTIQLLRFLRHKGYKGEDRHRKDALGLSQYTVVLHNSISLCVQQEQTAVITSLISG